MTSSVFILVPYSVSLTLTIVFMKALLLLSIHNKRIHVYDFAIKQEKKIFSPVAIYHIVMEQLECGKATHGGTEGREGEGGMRMRSQTKASKWILISRKLLYVKTSNQ